MTNFIFFGFLFKEMSPFYLLFSTKTFKNSKKSYYKMKKLKQTVLAYCRLSARFSFSFSKLLARSKLSKWL